MYTPRRTKLQFKIIFKELDPVPIASTQQYHIYILFKHIFFFLRKISRKMCSITHQIAQLTKNLWSNYYFHIKKLIFLQFLFYKVVAKYSPKCTKLHHFLKISRESMPPNPLSKRVALPRADFSKKYFEPSPQNIILGTQLITLYT